MTKRNVPIFAIIIFLFLATDLPADEIYLKNNDRVSGDIIEESEERVLVDTEAMGKVSISRDSIERIIRGEKGQPGEQPVEVVEQPVEEEIIWQRQLSVGYNASRGNTKQDQLSASISINRNHRHVNEITLKGNAYYSATNDVTEVEKWDALGRYAFSFGSSKMWYNFYGLEYQHDRFANIDYRLIPNTGVGYWFFDEPDVKLMAEAAVGLEHTNYRKEEEENNDEIVIVPRAYFEKGIFVNSKVSHDVKVFTSLRDAGEFRLHSESVFTNPLSDRLSVNFSIIHDYNSDQPEDVKKHDLRFISSLAYTF